MFDAEEVLKQLNGRYFSASDLYRELEKIHREHLRQLPSEFRSTELFKFGVRKGWFKEVKPRYYKVQVE